MKPHLLLVSIGPIQDFIAQARRTRDLWYGSHLLSELSRRVARTIAERGGVLVFPAIVRGDAELEPCLAPLRANGEPPVNVANKILAELPGSLDPERVATEVRAELRRFWRAELAGPVRPRVAGLIAHGTDEAWNEQIDTVLEFTAVWKALGDYGEVRRELEQAAAGRKTLRDFRQWSKLRGAVPKSSLDGARETVLKRPEDRDPAAAVRYRIGAGEQLDAVGLVKRAGGEPDQFVPLVNVAVSAWVQRAAEAFPKQTEALRRACLQAGVARVNRRDLPVGRVFDFDASVLFPDRWAALFEEQGLGTPKEAHAWGNASVRPLLAGMSDPPAYVACLVADGDAMGVAINALSQQQEPGIDGIDGATEHRTFSAHLARFAAEARRIVEQDFDGSLVYAGGDDVLAFLPVCRALGCADALRKSFENLMQKACARLSEKPTLSVGLGVGHVMEGMGDLLGLGRSAERLAKGADLAQTSARRNALAVLLDKRSGGRRAWRAQWSEWGGDPVARITADEALLSSRLSSRKVYEVAATLRRLPEAEGHEPAWSSVLELEVRRSFARVHGGDQSLTFDEVGLFLDPLRAYSDRRARTQAWVDRVLIARAFEAAVPRVRAMETQA